jgi:hypothetical protein
VAPETYQKSKVEEEGHPPVMHHTTSSYAPMIASTTQLRYIKYQDKKGNDVALQI